VESDFKMKQKILMCPPEYFSVDYVINPWMANNRGRTQKNLAMEQWANLRSHLAAYAEIVELPPQPGLPDMVFTANAGLVREKKAIVSRFRAPERQGEEPFFKTWFEQAGFTLAHWPDAVPFEGAGDALWDRERSLLWIGSGFRSDLAAASLVELFFKRPVAALTLVDPRFYHLDTCLCPLEGGYMLYFPDAFAPASRDKIASLVPQEKRIAVTEEDALRFACNAVDLAGHVFMNGATSALQNKLRAAGFEPVMTPLSEFMKSGGGAKCLTLKLLE